MYRFIKVFFFFFQRQQKKKIATSYSHDYLKVHAYTIKIALFFFFKDVYKLAQLEDIIMC